MKRYHVELEVFNSIDRRVRDLCKKGYFAAGGIGIKTKNGAQTGMSMLL